MIDGHAFAAITAASGGIFAGFLYLQAVWKGITKPHVFTWFIWGILGALGSVIAYSEHAYWSFFVILANSMINFMIVFLAWQRSDKEIKKSDTLILLGALAIIPIWIIIKEPLAAAILVSFVDIIGFFLTFKKAWFAPKEENIEIFSFFTMISLLGVLSVTPFTLTTALYPTVILLSNALLVIMLVCRQRSM